MATEDNMGKTGKNRQKYTDQKKKDYNSDSHKEEGTIDSSSSQDNMDSVIKTIHGQIKTVNEEIERMESKVDKSISNVNDSMQKGITALEKQINLLQHQMIEMGQRNARKPLEEGNSSISKKLEELIELTEMLEGKFGKVDELYTLLSDNGVTIKREIPPVSEEDQDVLNLTKYAGRIIEQLGYGTRTYVRERKNMEQRKKEIDNYKQVTEERIAVAKEQAEKEATVKLLQNLLEKYDSIDSIIDSTEQRVRLIWSFMMETGCVIETIDETELKKNNTISLSEELTEKMAARYEGIKGAGMYKVIKTGIVLDKEIICPAVFQQMEE